MELASRPPADPDVVVAGSTPVVAFGDPRPARVVTLGLNPSTRQFLHQNGSLRTGPERRLATLPWLGLGSWDELDRAAAGVVLSECAAYFSPGRVPYRRWFDPLDRVVAEGTGASYYDGTACHLNLVTWATDPVFSGLARSSWRRLLESDLPYVVEQLRNGGHVLVVVNGRTAMEEVAAAGLVEWTAAGELEGPPRARLCVGESASALYAGWTCNLQNQPGALRLAGALGLWLRGLRIAV